MFFSEVSQVDNGDKMEDTRKFWKDSIGLCLSDLWQDSLMFDMLIFDIYPLKVLNLKFYVFNLFPMIFIGDKYSLLSLP